MLNKRKFSAALVVLIIASATVMVSFPSVQADVWSSLFGIVHSIKTIVTRIDSNLNQVKVEQIITGSVFFNTSVGALIGFPGFNISGNKPWDLVAVYVSTNDVGSAEELGFGVYKVGARTHNTWQPPVMVADGADVTDFPLFASEMTDTPQSIIPVPPNVAVIVFANHYVYSLLDPGFTVNFKIVIERPIDPSFQANVTFGLF